MSDLFTDPEIERLVRSVERNAPQLHTRCYAAVVRASDAIERWLVRRVVAALAAARFVDAREAAGGLQLVDDDGVITTCAPVALPSGFFMVSADVAQLFALFSAATDSARELRALRRADVQWSDLSASALAAIGAFAPDLVPLSLAAKGNRDVWKWWASEGQELW